jgi:hypothetical protein
MAELNPFTQQPEFNAYAVGARHYGGGMRTNATSGPVSAKGQAGYADRDAAALRRKARAKAITSSFGTAAQPGYTTPSVPTTY